MDRELLRMEDLASFETEFDNTLIGLEQSERQLRLKLQQEEDRNKQNRRLNATLMRQMRAQTKSKPTKEISNSLLQQIEQIQRDINQLRSSRTGRGRKKRASSTTSQVEEMERRLAESEQDFFEWVKWRRNNAAANGKNFQIVKKLNDAMEKVLHAREQSSMEEARQQCVEEIDASLNRLFSSIQQEPENAPEDFQALKQSLYSKVTELCSRAVGNSCVPVESPDTVLGNKEQEVDSTKRQLLALNEQQEDQILKDLRESLSAGANEAVTELRTKLAADLQEKQKQLREEQEKANVVQLETVKQQLIKEHEKEMEKCRMESKRTFEVEKAKLIQTMKTKFAKSLHRLTEETDAKRKTQLGNLRKQLQRENEGKLRNLGKSLQRDLHTAKTGLVCQAEAIQQRAAIRSETNSSPDSFVLQEVESKCEEKT